MGMFEMRHNVVGILYAIRGMAETYLCREQENLYSHQAEALSHARALMKRIFDLADRALKITRKIGLSAKGPDSPDFPARQSCIREAWEKAVRDCSGKFPAGGPEMISRIPEGFPPVLCDPEDLSEIFCTLAENALQAMDGSGKIVVRAHLGFRQGGDPLAHIMVADTGPGIPEPMLTRLFEPFMTTKEPGQGGGLGLCLVRGLARKNNGSISVSSFRGSGTTVTLTFGIAGACGSKECRPCEPLSV